MKVLCSLAAFSVALFLASCSSTQKAEAPAGTPSEATSLTQRSGNIFHTRGKKAAPEETPAETAPEQAPVPTEEQQKAALAIMSTPMDGDAAPSPAPLPITEETATAPTDSAPAAPTLPAGGLRMGSIIPQEDPASAGEAPAPAANSAERFGLRSPKIPSKLPMGIDGKIQNAQ